jgi:hypothetical protein
MRWILPNPPGDIFEAFGKDGVKRGGIVILFLT